MGRQIDVEIWTKWRDLRPQVLQLARQEIDNHRIHDLLANIQDELPEGIVQECMHE